MRIASHCYWLHLRFTIYFSRRKRKDGNSVIVSRRCAAALLAAPWYLVLFTRGVERTAADALEREAKAGSWDTIAAWLNLTTNGQPVLLALSIAGLLLSIKKDEPRITHVFT